MTELRHFHSARKGSGSLRPFPIYPLYTQTVILSLDKPIADCFLFRPRKSREKRRKRSHTNVSNTLVARPSTPPAQTPQRSFQGAAAGTHATPAPNRAHSGLHGETRGVSALCEVDRGMIQQAGGNGCARLQRASASSGVAAPQGCGTFSLIAAWSFLHRY